MIRLGVMVRDGYTERHMIWANTRAISLITSDRKGAMGNCYSRGHFHCGAQLAICPIYAFNTHEHTHTHKHMCIYKYTLTN